MKSGVGPLSRTSTNGANVAGCAGFEESISIAMSCASFRLKIAQKPYGDATAMARDLRRLALS